MLERFRWGTGWSVLAVLASAVVTQAQTGSAGTQSTTEPPAFATTVTVIEAAPLPGLDLTIDKVPAPVQLATSADIEGSQALDLSSFLARRFNGVFTNDVQNNPFQPDINYR